MTSRTAGLWRHALVSTLAVLSSTAHALTPSQVFDAVKDSVVVVKTLDAEGKQISQGSGVLLPGGRVATNCHVIKDGASFYAGRDKQFVSATVFAGNGDKDICLLNAKGIKGKSSTLGKASSLKIGEPVYAVGAPQGLELSLSDGIVSQLRGDSPPLIQTTAAISPRIGFARMQSPVSGLAQSPQSPVSGPQSPVSGLALTQSPQSPQSPRKARCQVLH